MPYASVNWNFAIQRCMQALSACIYIFFISNFLCYAAEDIERPIFLFGKMEVKSSLASVFMWTDALERNKLHPLFTDNAVIKGRLWPERKQEWEKLPFAEQLAAVNKFWNQWPYRQDQDTYDTLDYWATPLEFYKNSGDCEDFAIIKYFTLIELGVSAKKMRIALVKDKIRNENHAVLVVYVEKNALVLDSKNNQISSHNLYKHYDIQFSLNEFFKWGHFTGH